MTRLRPIDSINRFEDQRIIRQKAMASNREASGERRFAATGLGNESNTVGPNFDRATVEHELAELTEREGEDLVHIEMLGRRLWYVRRW